MEIFEMAILIISIIITHLIIDAIISKFGNRISNSFSEPYTGYRKIRSEKE